MKKRCRLIRHWALTGHYEGTPHAVHRGGYVPPFAAWMWVDADEWKELREEGFYTRRQILRPTAYVKRGDQDGLPESLAEEMGYGVFRGMTEDEVAAIREATARAGK